MYPLDVGYIEWLILMTGGYMQLMSADVFLETHISIMEIVHTYYNAYYLLLTTNQDTKS